MAEQKWSAEQLQGLHNAVQSLKLYRRAELQNEATKKSMVDLLYTDPLPNEHVFQTIIKPNTTFLIGRKGTGKSTVIQKAQHELRKNRSVITAYIDIKTVYESAISDRSSYQSVSTAPDALAQETFERFLLYKAFISAAIAEIRTELKERVQSSLVDQIKEGFTGTVEMLFEGLDEVLADAESPNYISVLGSKRVDTQRSQETEGSQKDAASVSATSKPSLSVKLSSEIVASQKDTQQTSYADLLVRTFNIKELIARLRGLLKSVGVDRLYVFIDDFSELPEDAMQVVVDSLLAPLNNWSEELIKFKVAAYPGRVYYGSIDKTKIDEVYLDTYRLYGSSAVSTMEEKAIDFTRRLVETRVASFCDGADASLFFDVANTDFWRVLFSATMANPRILGYLLFYIYENHIIYGKRGGIRAIQEAAQKYYEEKLEPYFKMNKFLHQTFEERSSVLGMRELFDAIIEKARQLRSHDNELIKKIPGRAPTSHFNVIVEIESLLLSLELNFFLTKYYEQTDREGKKVSVFAINYGACQKNTIAFGRPVGEREFRLYFVERIFDYTPLLQKYIACNQEIVCDTCNESIGIDQLENLKVYGMLCPKCRRGQCRVLNLTKKYQALLDAIDDELLLPATDLGILQTLHSEDRPLFASDISGELDCSYQLIGKRAKNLDERGFVNRPIVNEAPNYNRRQFTLTENAKAIYFPPDSEPNVPLETGGDEEPPADQPESGKSGPSDSTGTEPAS